MTVAILLLDVGTPGVSLAMDATARNCDGDPLSNQVSMQRSSARRTALNDRILVAMTGSAAAIRLLTLQACCNSKGHKQLCRMALDQSGIFSHHALTWHPLTSIKELLNGKDLVK
jgi:hypothetical protein